MKYEYAVVPTRRLAVVYAFKEHILYNLENGSVTEMCFDDYVDRKRTTVESAKQQGLKLYFYTEQL